MYGLILENLADYIRQAYGEEKWEYIRREAGVEQPSFSVHQVYPEMMVPRLAKKAQQILGLSEQEFMDQMGVQFVCFVSQYGYDRVLSVLGRHMRDFLNGLDNLHEYLKFSYPRMKAPSFICENETRQGLTLHYRSKRRGFVYYTMGQIREVARHFYHKEMIIELIKEEMLFDTVHVTFQLTFDNRAFTLASLAMTREEKHLPISASVLFEIFPFCIVFGSDMIVRSIGNSLMVILPDLLGKKITKWFDLVRPLITFKFQTILNRTNNIFELVTVDAVLADRATSKMNKFNLDDDEHERNLRLKDNEDNAEEGTALAKVSDDKNVADKIFKMRRSGENHRGKISIRLKGQMIYMENWRMMMYLGTPVMPDLTSLITTGLYINDLSMHDFSRDLMLAGTQQSVELKLALDQEQQKSKKLEESMRKLDEEMKRTDELLYQMIPKQVADRLRTGENPIDTCETFNSVSVLFSDVVTFTEICSRITPMEVVSMLNAMYSIFDTLTEKNAVYKVETIGDAYMVVSGAPEKQPSHAQKVCDMALDMIEAITDLKDPSTGSHLQIRVGVHSGAVVAGIVGLKMPRYCLFGDSVNTASRMESTSEAMKIHVSQTTKELLNPDYELQERGEILVKGKGSMKTYWLTKKFGRPPLDKNLTAQALLQGTRSDAAPRPMSADLPGSVTRHFEEERRVYSPVTFEEVAKKSAANTPTKSAVNKSVRSNSLCTNRPFSPGDVFGSLVSDTDNFFDLHSHQTSSTGQYSAIVPGNVYRLSTAPAKTGDIRPPLVFDSQGQLSYSISPSHSAPAMIIKNKRYADNSLDVMEITELEDIDMPIAARRITEAILVDKATGTDFEIPREVEKLVTIPPPSSISDSNLVRYVEKSTSPKERASPLNFRGIGKLGRSSTKKISHKSNNTDNQSESINNNANPDNPCCGSFNPKTNKNKVVSNSCTVS